MNLAMVPWIQHDDQFRPRQHGELRRLLRNVLRVDGYTFCDEDDLTEEERELLRFSNFYQKLESRDLQLEAVCCSSMDDPAQVSLVF